MAVHDRGGTGFVHLRHELCHLRLRDFDQPQRGHVAVTEIEDPRPQTEAFAIACRVSEFDEGVQQAACGRSRDVRPARNIGQLLQGVVAIEGFDDGKSTRERSDVFFGVWRFFAVGGFFA